MKFKINCTPHLRMHEITKKLFNNEFLSDIRFKIGGRILHAHSLELMKRSEIFEVELLKMVDKDKSIKIDDCTYATFFEFIKFLYTDDCKINHFNGIGLLKLATKYNVIILENKIINSLATVEWIVQLFDHCIAENYYAAREQTQDLILANLDDCVKTKEFLSISLSSFNVIAEYRNLYVISDQIEEAIINCLTANVTSSSHWTGPLLLDINNMCMSRRRGRNEWKHRFEWRKYKRETVFETTFSVPKHQILHALWIGIEENRKDIEIIINENNINGFTSKEIRFTQSAPDYWQPMLIALGKTIRLKPNFQYSVTIKYLGIAAGDINVVCRTKDVDLIIEYHTKEDIKILKSSDNLLEILLNQYTLSERLQQTCAPS